MDFANKNPERDLFSLFEEWADSKDFSEEDKKEILREIILLLPKSKQILVPKLNIHLRRDPIALRDIIKIILLAIELADKDEKEGKNELDNQ